MSVTLRIKQNIWPFFSSQEDETKNELHGTTRLLISIKVSIHFWIIYGFIIFLLVGMQMAQTPLHVSAGYNNVGIIKHLFDWAGPEKVELEAKNMVCRSNVFMVLV